ncbi:MAG: YihY/virulence factor BrkB family protein [Candidatus Dormibacteraeota bacterium]|nr:YihY/virulence factor BrkB family protein [Candidatus Dormibacteraeota bacterium]
MGQSKGSNRELVDVARVVWVTHGRRDLLRLGGEVMAAMDRHGVLTDATAIAFRVLFAMAFLGLTGLAFAGVVHLEAIWRHQLGPGIAKVVSPNFYHELDHSVDQVLTARRWWWLTVGLVLTLWQVSSGVRALMGALDSIYEVKDRRPFWTRMGLSVLLALIVCVAAVLIAGILFLGGAGPAVVTLLRLVAIAVVLMALIATLLRFTTPAHLGMRWATLGSTLALITWLLTSWLFGWYLGNFAYRTYQQAFGILSLLVVVMTYLYLASVAFLVGAELDALAVTGASRKSRRPNRA